MGMPGTDETHDAAGSRFVVLTKRLCLVRAANETFRREGTVARWPADVGNPCDSQGLVELAEQQAAGFVFGRPFTGASAGPAGHVAPSIPGYAKVDFVGNPANVR